MPRPPDCSRTVPLVLADQVTAAEALVAMAGQIGKLNALIAGCADAKP